MKGVNSFGIRKRPIFEKEEVLNNNGRYSKALNLSYCISLDEIDFYEKFCTIIYSVFPNKSKRWFLLKKKNLEPYVVSCRLSPPIVKILFKFHQFTFRSKARNL